MSIIGAITSVVLAIISATKIGVFCPTCMAVYAVTLLQLLLVIVYRKDLPRPMNFKSISNGLTYVLLSIVVVVIPFQMFRTPSRDLQNNPQTLDDQSGDEEETDANENKVEIPLNLGPFSGLGEDYRAGSDEAKAVLVEFADFQCPACQDASQVVRMLKDEYGDRILVVFKNYPLDSTCNPSMQRKLHEFACDAAVLARCAGQIGKFWEFHNLAFDNQDDINKTNLDKWATSVGLSPDQIKECRESKDILAKIRDDIALGNKVGVQGTPTIFINGSQVMGGRSYPALKAQIDKVLSR
jgi:protein-disulfide isomerase